MSESKTSQVEVTSLVEDVSCKIRADKLVFLNAAKQFLSEYLLKKPYEPVEEAKIRWTRTAHRILDDGWVYEGKACTDITIAFIALCLAREMPANFVKVIWAGKKLLGVHSLAEIKVENRWYVCDPDGRGEIIEGKVELVSNFYYPGYSLKVWGRGRDSWDLGLKSIKDEPNLKS